VTVWVEDLAGNASEPLSLQVPSPCAPPQAPGCGCSGGASGVGGFALACALTVWRLRRRSAA
jgi:hypothetical protein